MKIRNFLVVCLLAGLFAILFNACKDDDAKPQFTRIHGHITFENTDMWASWKDSGEMQVTLFPAFSLDPLAGWGAVPAGKLGPTHPGGTFAVGAPYNSQSPVILQYMPGKTTYHYEIEVEPGIYSALAVGFRKTTITNPSCKTATLGVHHDKENEVSHGVVIKINTGGGGVATVMNYPPPSVIEIAKGEEKEINFKADFGFVNLWYKSCR